MRSRIGPSTVREKARLGLWPAFHSRFKFEQASGGLRDASTKTRTLPSYRLRSAQDETPLRQRASGIALALAINLVLLFVLLGIGAMRAGPPVKQSDTLVVTLSQDSASASSKSQKPQIQKRIVQPRPRIPHVLPIKPPIEIHRPLDLIPMTKEELAAADIRGIPTVSKATGSGMAGAADSEAIGRGPNGDVLYAADWARKPTDAELSGYLPPNASEGYGTIACKTLPQNRVDDCIEIDNYPRGSHLASAVRQAAWQFRVKPPRKNGRDLIGEWVRIRIIYTHSNTRIE